MTYRIPRHKVKATLDIINQSPWRVFTAKAVRRSTVYLRYPPKDMTENGTLVRVGDHSRLDCADRGNPNVIYDAEGRRYDLLEPNAARRKGDKIILQEAGETRWLAVKNYDREKGNGCKHAPEPTGKGRNYDPLQYDLYPLAGFYNDDVKTQPDGTRRIGRFGQWRPYSQVCMRGIIEFRALGHRWIVTDPPQDTPIEYPTEGDYLYSRQHVVTESGMTSEPRGVTADAETWERVMGLE